MGLELRFEVETAGDKASRYREKTRTLRHIFRFINNYIKTRGSLEARTFKSEIDKVSDVRLRVT